MRKVKIPGKAIIATARKIAIFIWHMLTEGAAFDTGKMVDKKLAKVSGAMKKEAEAATDSESLAQEVLFESKEKSFEVTVEKKITEKTGVARKKRKKAG
jgi:hypothetical protein